MRVKTVTKIDNCVNEAISSSTISEIFPQVRSHSFCLK